MDFANIPQHGDTVRISARVLAPKYAVVLFDSMTQTLGGNGYSIFCLHSNKQKAARIARDLSKSCGRFITAYVVLTISLAKIADEDFAKWGPVLRGRNQGRCVGQLRQCHKLGETYSVGDEGYLCADCQEELENAGGGLCEDCCKLHDVIYSDFGSPLCLEHRDRQRAGQLQGRFFTGGVK